MNAITESALLMDRSGVLLAANETVASRLGRPGSDIVGLCAYDLLPPEVADRRRKHVDKVFGSGIPERFEEERFGAVIDQVIYPVFGPHMNVAAVAIIGIDITERKKAEMLLRKSEKRLRDIAASLGEGLYVLGSDGAVLFMNPEAERLLGWTESELVGRNIHDAVHYKRPDGTPLAFEDCAMHRVIETGGRFYSRDEVFIRKDGTMFPVSVNCTPLFEDGTIVASVTAFRDITSAVQAARDRESLIADLQKALSEIRTIQGILPICSYCKKIRDDKGAWQSLELYIGSRTEASFSHGMCKECARKEFPQYFKEQT
jgi:PAS domain S-box-containing protein